MHKNLRILTIAAFIAATLMTSIPLQAKRFTIHPLLKSAILPGWGQLSLNKYHGYGMLAGEVAIWSTYFYNSNEQDLKARESYEYALKFAHTNPGTYSAQYYKDLSRFDSSGFEAGGYNDLIRQTALELYPDSPALQQDYINDNAMPDELAWSWDSYTDRRKFSTMRKDILELKDQAQLLTGLVIANHIISSIDMLRLKKQWGTVQPSVQYYRNSPSLFLNVEF